MKIMSIFGTRPEIIRLSRIFELLDNNFEHVMVNTSQNFTHELNTVFFDEMKIRKPDYDMRVNTEAYGKEVADVIIKAEKLLKKEKPDIVHTFLPENNTVGGFIAELAGIKIRIASRRNRNHYRKQQPLFTHFEDWINRRATLILGNSRAVLNDLLNEGIEAERLGVIYNGVEAERFRDLDRNTSRLDFGLELHQLCLTVVANFNLKKRHVDLLEALAQIKTSLPDQWILFLVGRNDGTEGKLKQLAKEKDLEANVRFFGPRDDVAKILAASDIGILSSEEEGFANAILEYMAAGLPVVATDVGGNREAITEQEGFVVPKGDTKAMANAILQLALDRNLRQKMGRLGRLRAMKTFSVDSMVKEHQKVYLELLSPK